MPQEKRPDRESYDIVVPDDLRPAGNGKDCFYCGMALHGLHRNDCVIRKGAGWYHVAIRDNRTGEVRLYREDMEWDEHDHFSWTENNYSCDCNRHLFFLRANGPGPADDPHWNNADRECGEELYTALYAELPTGERIELDLPSRRMSIRNDCQRTN